MAHARADTANGNRCIGPEFTARISCIDDNTTALMIIDAFARGTVRFTEDFDIIVHLLAYRSAGLLWFGPARMVFITL